VNSNPPKKNKTPPTPHTHPPSPSSLCRNLFQLASSATPLAVLMAVQLLAVSDDPHPLLTPPIPTTPPTKASLYPSLQSKHNRTHHHT